MRFLDDQQFILLNALDHGEMDESKDVHGCFVDDGLK
jgi:hypothetical protein|tara:strand:- start:2492 stop:2602 length:111 start_codon:yes stop_codon:yes gene_type:complete